MTPFAVLKLAVSFTVSVVTRPLTSEAVEEEEIFVSSVMALPPASFRLRALRAGASVTVKL